MKNYVNLNKNYEFQRIYKYGKSFILPSLVVYINRNRENQKKIGITTSRKIGNAVRRNRARRVIKEAFNVLNKHIKNGFSLVFVARVRTCEVKMQVILKEMENHIKKAGLWL